MQGVFWPGTRRIALGDLVPCPLGGIISPAGQVRAAQQVWLTHSQTLQAHSAALSGEHVLPHVAERSAQCIPAMGKCPAN